jgi:UDP-N-acetylmuramoyl-tripeptide--D-alanyl-D-alanine ligase
MLWFAALAVCFGACSIVTALHDCHMFQLNSYKPREHLRWLRRTWMTDWLPRHIFAALAALSSLLSFHAAVAGIFLFVIQTWWNRPRKAKKPLVFTSRIKRLLATGAVLHLLILWFAWRCLPAAPLVFAVALLLSPGLMLLANFVNAPLETFINRRYIEDARRILASNPNLVVIGVTGSFGKTSVKHFLQRLLSTKYNVFMTPGNYNTTLGVVRAVREGLRPVHDVFLCEMGARNIGDIREICELVKPKHGVVTAIGPQHLESFHSLANVISTKFELIDSLPQDGIAFLNYDSEDIRHRDVKGLTATYCLEPETADYVARDIRVSSLGSSFMIKLANGSDAAFETRLIGRHNVLNIAGAIGVADRLGVPARDLAAAVRRLESVPHRLQLINRGDLTIIDDAYNSNATGAKAALDVLAMFDGFRILVTPGMVELGTMEESLNREFGRQAAARCDCVVLVGEKRTRPILDGLRSAGMADETIHVVDTIEEAFRKVYTAASGGRRKIVLLENDLPDNY